MRYVYNTQSPYELFDKQPRCERAKIWIGWKIELSSSQASITLRFILLRRKFIRIIFLSVRVLFTIFALHSHQFIETLLLPSNPLLDYEREHRYMRTEHANDDDEKNYISR